MIRKMAMNTEDDSGLSLSEVKDFIDEVVRDYGAEWNDRLTVKVDHYGRVTQCLVEVSD